ncbi:MAG TPA: hypothetical protein RMH85_21190 [Polyangiaceae bacterium LLY-WYZ-15_(1-7)]|nr:hypothetical protein [Myxococcales bacterium]MAT23994.1 hypothetical protein [Sandaracinus sp.]HJK91340.1 hypothetical protein [Polyangiaceae bacterium LLY-WYZ-15_(1-7)]HJL00413.1 hypothetical protein [Polyangiaceae bacterium LLY-WYZ-15_(1-7)]HJL11004.1 hypothetical protein [Polyangiaceae bacterium LLY-WYZ-15_(1-7)]
MDSHPAVSTSVREVVSLFEEDTLEGVRFPDLDLETLLEGCAEVQRAQEEVDARLAALEQARAELDRERAALQKLARRAVDYARVFASEDEELLARLDGLTLAAKPKKKKRKSTRKKASAPKKDDAQLALAKEDAA